MTRKQWLVIILLGVADLVVLGGLIGAVLLAPRLLAPSPPHPTPTVGGAGAVTLEPTWTPTPSPEPTFTATRGPTRTPSPSPTPLTLTPTPTPTPALVPLENGDFEAILPDGVPGWEVAAEVNWEPGDAFNPDTSYGRPEFKPADDPRRVINGSTLQIQTYQWVKFKVILYQTVEVEPGSRVWFEAKAGGYSSGGSILVRVGIDAHGGEACQYGEWSDVQAVDQSRGVILLRSPEAVVAIGGQVTVCLSAEPKYALIHNAAFFDDAKLWMLPPAR